MCNKCHQALSDEGIEKTINRELNTPDFKVWNSTSVNHIRLAAMGVNGPVIQEKAERLFIEYMKYYKNLPSEDYVPAVYESLAKTLDEIQQFRIRCHEEQLSRKVIQNIVFHGHEASAMDLVPSLFGIVATCVIIYFFIRMWY